MADRGYNLKSRYGITIAEYDEMLEKQNGVCAICREAPIPGSNLHVDHSHHFDVVRGLLCARCNQGLGYFRESIPFFFRAIKYLNEHPSGGYV